MKRVWTADELVEYWTLTPDELRCLPTKLGRPGLALPSCSNSSNLKDASRSTGTRSHRRSLRMWPSKPMCPPTTCSSTIGAVAQSNIIAQIREVLGFREATVQDTNEVTEWLLTTWTCSHDMGSFGFLVIVSQGVVHIQTGSSFG